MNGLATNQNGIHPFCAVSDGPSNKEGFLNPFSDNYRFEICFSFEFENLISNSGEEFGDGAEQVTQQAVSPWVQSLGVNKQDTPASCSAGGLCKVYVGFYSYEDSED